MQGFHHLKKHGLQPQSVFNRSQDSARSFVINMDSRPTPGDSHAYGWASLENTGHSSPWQSSGWEQTLRPISSEAVPSICKQGWPPWEKSVPIFAWIRDHQLLAHPSKAGSGGGLAKAQPRQNYKSNFPLPSPLPHCPLRTCILFPT